MKTNRRSGGPLVTRVLIVDDHDFFRGCLVDLVNASQDLEAVGECTDGAEVPSAVRELHPHVVVMDVRMGAVSGIDAAAALQREEADARVIMLTSDTAPSTRAAAEANGAVGYLIKGSDADLVLQAIRHVAQGGTAWPEDLSGLSTVA
jgi:DNA-binding NarL/FixJ family response regulator